MNLDRNANRFEILGKTVVISSIKEEKEKCESIDTRIRANRPAKGEAVHSRGRVYRSTRERNGKVSRREERRRGNRIDARERRSEEVLPGWRHPAESGANSHHEPAMGKLATTRRRVTRDNEEQEASVCSLGPSGASSGRAFVAVPIRGIALDSDAVSRTLAIETLDQRGLRRFRECRPTIDGEFGWTDSTEPLARVENITKEDRTTARGVAGESASVEIDGSRGIERPDRRVPDNLETRFFVETATGNEPCNTFYAFGNVNVREDCSPSETQSEFTSEGKAAGRLKSSTSSSIILIAMAIVVLCAPISCVPMPSRMDPLLRTGPRHNLDRSTGLEDVYEDAFEDAFREEDQRQVTRTVLDESELEIIRRSIARGLGLKRIPDPSKANVSQVEYERAHREYLKKVQQLSFDEQSSKSRKRLHVFHATAHPGNGSNGVYETRDKSGQYRHRLFFPVEIPKPHNNASVDHATLRLLLHGHYSERPDQVDVLLYLKKVHSRKLIVRQRIELRDPRDSRWLEFDSTVAVSSWLEAGLENLGLELEFLRDGESMRRAFSSPVLNVFTDLTSQLNGRSKRSTPEELMSLHKGRRTKCKGESKKCCRHELTVMFKDLKGFEFIVYPKTFDAGYCKGRCPPRYNPAHHHALLQSLLWKEDRKKVPKPCCAPSKLDQLMIVYFDENDSTQLKVSYWKNIQVLECACS